MTENRNSDKKALGRPIQDMFGVLWTYSIKGTESRKREQEID